MHTVSTFDMYTPDPSPVISTHVISNGCTTYVCCMCGVAESRLLNSNKVYSIMYNFYVCVCVW